MEKPVIAFNNNGHNKGLIIYAKNFENAIAIDGGIRDYKNHINASQKTICASEMYDAYKSVHIT